MTKKLSHKRSWGKAKLPFLSFISVTCKTICQLQTCCCTASQFNVMTCCEFISPSSQRVMQVSNSVRRKIFPYKLRKKMPSKNANKMQLAKPYKTFFVPPFKTDFWPQPLWKPSIFFHCTGTMNGTRGVSCKNGACNFIFKEVVKDRRKLNLVTTKRSVGG